MSLKTFEHLEAIRKATNEILQEALERKEEIGGAVNWADLSCVEARYIMNDGGDEYFEAMIEEASPGSSELIKFVNKRLEERGFFLLNVVCEW